MSKKLTTEQFVKKAKAVHGDRYDYGKVVYDKAHNKVKITCQKHGDFNQTPASHLNGRGCPKCANLYIAKLKTSNLDEFIERAKSVHGGRFDYTEAVYVGATEKIKITCREHGVFNQTPASHLSGNGCPKCANLRAAKLKTSNLDEFIKKAKIVHGDKYSYERAVYILGGKKIKIICPYHGEFSQTPNNHLRGKGCHKCTTVYPLNLNKFIKKAKTVHGEKYSYTETVYNGARNKVKIICEKHGIFEKTPSVHLKGEGCPKCGYERSREANSLNAPGWRIDSWVKAAHNSKNFDSFKLYLVLCGDEKKGEYFLKVGRTFLKVEDRLKVIPYKWREICVFQSDAETVYNIENELKQKHKNLKSVPSIRFGGMGECFSISALDVMMTEFEKLND